MANLRRLFRCIAEGVCARGLRALVGVVPFGEVLCDVAAHAWQRLRQEQRDDDLRECIAEAALASAAVARQAAREAIDEVCPEQPEEIKQRLTHYLAPIPSLVRQTLRRPGDGTAVTVPPDLSILSPDDLLAFLPARLPRFKPGDVPPGVGDWELVDLLGVGGFGEVWKAKHRFFDGIAPVALKFCLDESARERLLKHEAGVLNRVMRHGRHPGIVPLEHTYLTADPPCLEYEYVEGGDLAGVAREWRELPALTRMDRATRLVATLAAVVGEAHRLEPPIVHRDLKPANVLIERDRAGALRPRVADFGIGAVACLPSLQAARLGTTTRGEWLATLLRGAHTPLYASPQQVRGEPADVRDDVHALGVIWYQLLLGDVSVAPAGLWADELEQLGWKKELIRLLGACVSPRPEKRPRDAADLAGQIEALVEPEGRADRGPERLRKLLRTIETNPFAWLLDLTNKQIGDEGVEALVKSPCLSRLSVLYLSGNLITDAGVQLLAESPGVRSLSRLILGDNQIGDEGVKALAASPHLVNLTALDLGHNRVGDAGAAALARSPHLSSLNVLILVSNRVGDAGALALAESETLSNLAELKPLNNRIGSAGVTALRTRFGKRVRVY